MNCYRRKFHIRQMYQNCKMYTSKHICKLFKDLGWKNTREKQKKQTGRIIRQGKRLVEETLKKWRTLHPYCGYLVRRLHGHLINLWQALQVCETDLTNIMWAKAENNRNAILVAPKSFLSTPLTCIRFN